MHGIDPYIFKHCIDTWPNVAPICKNKIHIHPSKDPDFKSEIEKLFKVGFIYPIAYTTWVSNSVLVNKK